MGQKLPSRLWLPRLDAAGSTARVLRRLPKAAGSRRKRAALLGITEGSIRHWEQVPAHQIIKIEKLTGVPREQLRPDHRICTGSDDRTCAVGGVGLAFRHPLA
jgi:DNA-binding transcriptional regulator YdaS (Cro superfamily)